MYWTPLKEGDVIDLVAPSAGVKEEDLSAIKEAVSSLGFTANIPDELIGDDPLSANTDEQRFAFLKEALLNSNSKAIWPVRGGYGLMRLMPMLEALDAPAQQKLIIGFSDVTALHLFLNQNWNWPSLHAPMPYQISKGEIDTEKVEVLKKVLLGETKKVTLDNLSPLNDAASQKRNIESVLSGGNLTLVANSLATHWQIDADKKIVLLEDVDEEDYQIDRMLTHLQQADVFDNAEAILFGSFTHKKKPETEEAMMETITRFAKSVKVPVVQTNAVGHNSGNTPLPLGTEAILTLGDVPTLEVVTGYED